MEPSFGVKRGQSGLKILVPSVTRLSSECQILDVSQLYRPLQSVIRKALLLYVIIRRSGLKKTRLRWVANHRQALVASSFSPGKQSPVSTLFAATWVQVTACKWSRTHPVPSEGTSMLPVGWLSHIVQTLDRGHSYSSRFSRECLASTSQPCRPPRLVTGIVLLLIRKWYSYLTGHSPIGLHGLLWGQLCFLLEYCCSPCSHYSNWTQM
jgi:hypothetical protein